MRSRTTAGFVIIIAVVLACCITTLLTLARNSGELESYQQLQSVANKAKDSLQYPDWKNRLTTLADSADVVSKNIYIGVLYREPRRDTPPGPQPPPTILWSSQQNMPPMRPQGDQSGKPTAAQKKWEENWHESFARAGHGMAAIAYRSTQGFQHDMNRQRLNLLLMGGLVIVAVGFGAWFVVGLTLSPIRKLANQAANASTEDLNVRLEPPSNDVEVVELVTTLNTFLQNMAETAESKGRFYAAASHELRTPLMALSGHLELALSRERSADEYKQALEEAKKQSGRLKSLVQSLLLLHQLENNQIREKDLVNLTSACKSTLHQLQPVVNARHLSVEVEAPEGFSVASISNHAEILVRNLLENAVKYATAGGKVRLVLRKTQNGSEMEVFDECEPIPNWSSDKLEAFYRPDAARNEKTGGNGLGLAICRAIAQANGWELVVDEVDGGFLARVDFSSDSETSPPKSKKTREKPAIGGVAEHPA